MAHPQSFHVVNKWRHPNDKARCSKRETDALTTTSLRVSRYFQTTPAHLCAPESEP